MAGHSSLPSIVSIVPSEYTEDSEFDTTQLEIDEEDLVGSEDDDNGAMEFVKKSSDSVTPSNQESNAEELKLNDDQPLEIKPNPLTQMMEKRNSRRIPKKVRKPVKRAPGESDESYQYRESQRKLILKHYNFNRVEYLELDPTLVAPLEYSTPEIPSYAPKSFISARAYMQLTQSKESQHDKSLTTQDYENMFINQITKKDRYASQIHTQHIDNQPDVPPEEQLTAPALETVVLLENECHEGDLTETRSQDFSELFGPNDPLQTYLANYSVFAKNSKLFEEISNKNQKTTSSLPAQRRENLSNLLSPDRPSTSKKPRISECNMTAKYSKRMKLEYDSDEKWDFDKLRGNSNTSNLKYAKIKRVTPQGRKEEGTKIKEGNKNKRDDKPLTKKAWSKMLKELGTLSQRERDFDKFMMEDPLFTVEDSKQIMDQELFFAEKFRIEDQVNEVRQNELAKQAEYCRQKLNKPTEETVTTRGSLLLLGQTQMDGIILQNSISKSDLKKENVYNIPHNEIIDYKFDVRDLMQSEEDIFINLGYNVKLIIGRNSRVGFDELKLAFLSAPGVDPKVLHEKWLENAYMMVAITLIWMENNFNLSSKVFTPENILLQLKYRYDREIDLSERSAIRGITELDEIPQKRMILRVHGIHFVPTVGYELELSDGWYKIRTTVDKCIAMRIDAKQIEVNKKLVISNATLMNFLSQGFYPLDTPDAVKLKISGNSTKLADVDQTLGLCEDYLPFHIPLDSVSSDGGTIGELKVYITHVYSPHYYATTAKDNDISSNRFGNMQRQIENKTEVIFEHMFTKIYEKTVKEYHRDIKKRAEELKALPFNSYSIEEICLILEHEQESYASNYIYSQLNSKKSEQVKVCLAKLKEQYRNWTINEMEVIEQQKFVNMLKFRVVDEEEPTKTAIVTWYKPSNDLVTLVKEGKLIKINGAIAIPGSPKEELCIDAPSECIFFINETESVDKYRQFIRKETLISEIKVGEFNPPHNEMDIACMVIRIVDKEENVKEVEQCQHVIVVDDNKNFLAIKFMPSISIYVYDNFIKEGKILFIRDLQWCNKAYRKKSSIPEAAVGTNITTFSLDPQKDTHRARLEAFKANITKEYYQQCVDLLEELLPTKIVLRVRKEDDPELAKKYSWRYHGKPCRPRRFFFKA